MRKPSLRYEKNLWRKGYHFVAGVDEAGRGPLAGPVVAAAVVAMIGGVAVLKKLSQNLPVRDSKLLSSRQREVLYQKIIIHPQIDWGIGIVSEKIIDEINILEATKFAMIKAVANLSHRPDWLLVDGNRSMLLAMTSKTLKWLQDPKGGYPVILNSPCLAEAFSEGGFQDPVNKTFLTHWMLKLVQHDGSVAASLCQRNIISGDKKVFSIACASIVAKVTRDKIMTDLHKIYPQYGFNQHKGYGTKLHFAKLAQCGVSPVHRRSFRPVSEFIFS